MFQFLLFCIFLFDHNTKHLNIILLYITGRYSDNWYLHAFCLLYSYKDLIHLDDKFELHIKLH